MLLLSPRRSYLVELLHDDHEQDLSLLKEPRILNYLLFPCWPGYPAAAAACCVRGSYWKVLTLRSWKQELPRASRQLQFSIFNWRNYARTPVNMVHSCQIIAIFALSYLPSCLAWILVLPASLCYLPRLANLFLRAFPSLIYFYVYEKKMCIPLKSWSKFARIPGVSAHGYQLSVSYFVSRIFYTWGAPFSRKFLIKLKIFVK